MEQRTATGELTCRMGIPRVGRMAPAPEGTPRLLVLMGRHAGRRYPLHGSTMTVGRSDECDIQIDDTKVSRQHVRLAQWEDGSWVLEDLGSRNGTLVNGEPVQVKGLRFGDRVQLSGDTLLLFTRQDPLEDLLLHRQQMEVIGQLAAGIAHDFNNLLNVIAANLAHLETLDPDVRLGDAEVAECRADMTAAASRAAELTARLLTIARRRDERGAAPPEAVDVSQLCHDVVKLVRRTFDRSITIEANVEPGLTVDGEPTALHQLSMNLCINARDAMPSGGVLTVGARRASRPPEGAPWGEGPHVILEVRDTGVGMDAKTRARVFEPFFTTKERGAGSGLGLATVYEVATSHGGHVEVESHLGRGAAFSVSLPAHVERPERASQRRTRRACTDGRELPRSKGLVLVVDDQELVRRSLGRLLVAAGHEVIYGSNGEEALALFERASPRPDVVVMDLDMPKLSGEEALRELRARHGGVRVVLVSGYHDEARRRALLKAGAADFLTKPIDAQQLRDSVELAIRIPSVSV